MRPRRSQFGFGVLIVAAGFIAGAVARRRFASVVVEGTSMSPSLAPGDRVLIKRGLRTLRVNDIVVVARPHPTAGWRNRVPVSHDVRARPWLIKRVVAVPGDKFPPQIGQSGLVPPEHVLILGDHHNSIDSKQHGPCPTEQILGTYIRKIDRE